MTKDMRPYYEHVVLVGLPCVGKGEHVKVIKANGMENATLIEMGALVRAEIASGSLLGKKVAAETWSGNLLADKYITKLIEKYNFKQDMIFDGYPRTPVQAREYINKTDELDKYFVESDTNTMVIYIKAKPETVEYRMGLRLKSMEAAGKTIRKDDQLDVLRGNRIPAFNKNAPEVLRYFEKRGAYVLELNGDEDILAPDNAGGLERRVKDITGFMNDCRKLHVR